MKTLSRCRNNIEADNVVLIDVDTYNFNNVIVLDIPESHTKKQGGPNDKTRPSKTYIYIDDDEPPCNLHDKRNFETGASSSRRYGSENNTPVKLSKGKRTYSGRRFSAKSDGDSSDDEGPDCEFMEDFSGELREQWEKAALKRKGVAHNDHTRGFGANKNTQTHDQGLNINGTGNEKEGEPSNCDARDADGGGIDDSPIRETLFTNFDLRDVNGGKDDVPVGETLFTNFDLRDVKGGKDDVPVGETLSTNFDAGNVNGGKDDLPHGEAPSASSEEENEKNDDDVPVESSIIDQREKLKETDEYKRALELELSERQKALQIQAEEAQQLRLQQKRKRAEQMRLLDMERRQKQRVEEIRESQKKDEENMNLKEQYRVEIRQELKRLEITCLDMASLLCGLGIQVGKGPVPLSHEVRTAYKRALLSFHPDRASGSDMRQQVEAEEKFKLISRMKEKFSL